MNIELSWLEDLCRKWKRHRHHDKFTVKVKQICRSGETMADGIIDGGSGTFQAFLNLNGTPTATQPQFTWSTDVASATITPSADTTSAVIAVPDGEPATSITVTAVTQDPNGNTVSGFRTVPLSAPQVFTVVVSQTA